MRLLQIPLRAKRGFDPRTRVAYLEPRLLSSEFLHQLDVSRSELRADVVGNLRRRPIALVPTLVDEPLPDEFLVEHPLILAALEPLFTPFGDPVAARIGRVDLVDYPDLSLVLEAG